MAYVHPDTEWPDVDPPPTVATSEEIAVADEIRRALERRYLGTTPPPPDGGLPSEPYRPHGSGID